jgi:hypothetical protein
MIASLNNKPAMLSYFLQIVGYLVVIFEPPMKFEFLKAKDPADRWSPMSDSLNNKHVLSCGYWILFSNPPLKFKLDRVEGCY